MKKSFSSKIIYKGGYFLPVHLQKLSKKILALRISVRLYLKHLGALQDYEICVIQ